MWISPKIETRQSFQLYDFGETEPKENIIIVEVVAILTTFDTSFATFDINFVIFYTNFATFDTNFATFDTNFATFDTNFATFDTNFVTFETNFASSFRCFTVLVV